MKLCTLIDGVPRGHNISSDFFSNALVHETCDENWASQVSMLVFWLFAFSGAELPPHAFLEFKS